MYHVYPQRDEFMEIIGYIRLFRGKNGKYIYKRDDTTYEIEDHEMVQSDDPVVIAFWESQSQPEPSPSIKDELDDIKLRLDALEASKGMAAK